MYVHQYSEPQPNALQRWTNHGESQMLWVKRLLEPEYQERWYETVIQVNGCINNREKVALSVAMLIWKGEIQRVPLLFKEWQVTWDWMDKYS